MKEQPIASIIHLRAAGSSLVLDARDTGAPIVVHWGAGLGALDADTLASLADSQVPAVSPSSIDGPLRLSMLPLPSEGWSGTPGLAVSRNGQMISPVLTCDAVSLSDDRSLTVLLGDPSSGLSVCLRVSISGAGVLELRHTITNIGTDDLELASLIVALPVPARAEELLDFSGRWSFERRPQRRGFDHGTLSRRTRHGRTGHDSPFLLAAGTPGFNFRSGEVWGLHLAWSGDQDVLAESHPTGHSLLAAGELLTPGEVTLAPAESYSSPLVLAAWSGDGLDGLSEEFHGWVRERRERPLPPRPVMLNTWEAVYFDHDQTRLIDLAEAAAAVGVERFVLDDGWMIGRTDDRRALGDWTVDPVRWPLGLHPLVNRVEELGMDFGLWVEPEMVSLDSDLARRHPDWVLRGNPTALPQPWRHQFALDLDNPAAFVNILGQLCSLIDEYPIRFLKWDQNRDLLGGSAHRQTLATWRLMEELRERYPLVEIESCSSGGARIDLGVLDRTDRVWVSDTNDPLERQAIQRWTSVVVPPEYLGSHLGAATAHTTGRTTDLSFRLATALLFSAGIEWDLTTATPGERDAIAAWITLYKSSRGMLHSGRTVRTDSPDPGILVHGVIASDLSQAIITVACVAASRDAIPPAVTFPGLDPERRYRIAPIDLGPVRTIQEDPPPWLARGEIVLTGRMIAEVGVAMPALAPAQAIVLGITSLGITSLG